jgi:hypothetical protein
MALFLDIHNHVPGLTKDAVAGAHQKDLETQDKHGVKYLKYWFNEGTGQVFCLIEAPDKEAAMRAAPGFASLRSNPRFQRLSSRSKP